MVSVDIKHHERRREYESCMPLTCRTWHSKTLRPKNNRVQKLVVVYRGCRPFCFTFTEARWLSRDGDGRRKRDGSTADTSRKRPERPWTAARTMEVLKRCPLASAQRLVHCAIAVSPAVLGQSQGQCPLHYCWGTTRSERSPTQVLAVLVLTYFER